MYNRGMILAAGYGTRMQPITSQIPKPMVEVGSQSLIERTILKFYSAGIDKIIVNIHHLAKKLIEHLDLILDKHQLKNKIELIISFEQHLLESGGAIKNVIDFFDNKPFFVANGDSIWLGKQRIFDDLTTVFEEHHSSNFGTAALLVTRKKHSIGYYSSKKDFQLIGSKLKIQETILNNCIYTGLKIIDPRLYKNNDQDIFSNLEIYQKLSLSGNLYGVDFTGDWLHVGDPAALGLANDYLKACHYS